MIKKIIGSDAVLKDTENNFLFQRRTKDAPHSAGKDCLFGGGTEKDENPAETLTRELKEELDLDIKNIEKTFIGNIEYKENHGNLSSIHIIKDIDYKKLILSEGEKIVKYKNTEEILKSKNIRKPLKEFFIQHKKNLL